MSRFDEKNGGAHEPITGVLARSLERERSALAVPSDEEGEHLDREMLTAWLLDKSGPHQKRQRCVVFGLFHDHKVEGRTVVTSSTVFPKDAPEAERARLAALTVDEFDYESREVTKHFPDLQRFVVCAYKKEGATDEERREDPEFSRNFSVDPPKGAPALRSGAYVGPGSGDLDVTQIVSQILKDKQDLQRQLTQNMQAFHDRLVDHNRDLMEHVETLMKERRTERLQLEDALNQHQTREADALDRRMRTDAQWMVFSGGFELLKTFATKWMAAREHAAKLAAGEGGGEALPAAQERATASADAPFLEFAKTLEPPQILTIITALSPEQQEKFHPMASALIASMPPEKQALMMDLFKAHQAHVARKKAEEEAARRARENTASDIKVTVHDPLGGPPGANVKKGAKS
jgi:hypothetical protein